MNDDDDDDEGVFSGVLSRGHITMHFCCLFANLVALKTTFTLRFVRAGKICIDRSQHMWESQDGIRIPIAS
jgi:hypothetical protein